MVDFATFNLLKKEYREARKYGDHSKLIQELRNGNPEVLNNPEIRNFLADRVEKLPERSRGNSIVTEEQEKEHISIIHSMSKYIALEFIENSNSENYKKETAASLTGRDLKIDKSKAKREWRMFQSHYQQELTAKLLGSSEDKNVFDAYFYPPLIWGSIILTTSNFRAAYIHNSRKKLISSEIDKVLENYFSTSTEKSTFIDATTESEQILLGKKWLIQLALQLESKTNPTRNDEYYIRLASWGH